MSARLRPRRLEEGDLLGIFSPSEPLTEDRQRRMVPSLELLQKTFRYKFAPNAHVETSYTAGTPEQRLADIATLAADPDVAGLIGSWGGKSANQLVRHLPYELLREARKPIFGFSDVCVLLNAITATTGLITFAGPNVAGKLHESSHWDFGLARGKHTRAFGDRDDENWTTVKAGGASGILFGGNLSTFVLGLTGTPQMAQMHDVVFFWESASEPPQIIDQHLSCLENAGFFERVRAMVVGDVTYKNEEARKDVPIEDVLEAFAARWNIPAVKLANFGHRSLENPIVPIGAGVEIDTSEKEIRLTEPVVDGDG